MQINNKVFFIFATLALCSLVYIAALFYSPIPNHVIDRDNSGVISIVEAINGLDFGERVVSGQPNCIEYYWLKDGLKAYENCTEQL
jgi:hypothetical protein